MSLLILPQFLIVLIGKGSSNNKYCKVTYNGSEGYVYRYDLSSSQVDPATCPKEVEASCYYDETNDKYIWSEEDLSDKYTIDASATTEDDCNALNGDGEKNCKTSNKQTEVKETKKQVKKDKDIYIIDAEERLSNIFGTKVNISTNKKKGKIEISYNGEDELNDILSMILEEY